MPQFFIDATLEKDREIELRGADAHHIALSLRLSAGDWIVLSDGSGRSFRAVISQASASRVIARIEREIARRAGRVPPALAIATIRPERFEWAIQKVVELGCRHILPFRSARTVRGKGGDGDGKRLARWRTIALEAAKQSGLPFRPEVDPPANFEELCGRFAAFSPTILFFEGESKRSIRTILQNQTRSASGESEGLIVIGPEGGYAAEEVDLARASGAVTASLGQQILKAETAAVAAFTVCQYEFGNLDLV
jgi:16S rRNA (uracil1498-N3)-methyltransferase